MAATPIPEALPTGLPDQELWLGSTPAMRQVGDHLQALAQTERTGALILGESGTGKELAARAIHHLSRRRARPFLAVNCGALPTNLAESELFGAERGGYTDARARRGLVEQAHLGTLFLDEIGELPLSIQRTLLRFLETRQYRRLGSEQIGVADVRVVAATLRDLSAAVRMGTFREDLLFRINVFVITLPPLRERMDDLPTLMDLTLRALARQHHMAQPPSYVPETLAALAAYPWPGNIRELRNVLESALIVSRGTPIAPDHLPDQITRPWPARSAPGPSLSERIAAFQLPAEGADLPDLIHRLEEVCIAQALERAEGNQSRAARLLGMTRDQLRHRLRQR